MNWFVGGGWYVCYGVGFLVVEGCRVVGMKLKSICVLWGVCVLKCNWLLRVWLCFCMMVSL